MSSKKRTVLQKVKPKKNLKTQSKMNLEVKYLKMKSL